VFNTGLAKEMIAGETNVTPDDILDGKWVLISFAPSSFGTVGSLINAGWKYLTELTILKRKANENTPFVTIWCDEAHLFVNSFDSSFIAQCRSHRGCEIVISTETKPTRCRKWLDFPGKAEDHDSAENHFLLFRIMSIMCTTVVRSIDANKNPVLDQYFRHGLGQIQHGSVKNDLHPQSRPPLTSLNQSISNFPRIAPELIFLAQRFG